MGYTIIIRNEKQQRELIKDLVLLGLAKGVPLKRINQNIAHFLIKDDGIQGHDDRAELKEWSRRVVKLTAKRFILLEQRIQANGDWKLK